jgi:GTP pyrophosphokinase
VSAIILEFGGTEDQAIAGLLHDGPEDQGGLATLEKIRTEFGAAVASMVEACTDTYEDPKPAWQKRKEDYIDHLETLDRDALMVSVADKLHNARAILADHRTVGESVWSRFTGGRAGTLWYYRALVEAYRRRGHSPLVAAFDATVSELERAAGGRALLRQ